jgi:hypothetical protein
LSGLSAIMASVVISSEATEAASSSAVRTTLAGSITPNLNMSPYSSVWALKPKVLSFDSRTLPATTARPRPRSRDLAQRRFQRAAHDGDAGVLVAVGALEAVSTLPA